MKRTLNLAGFSSLEGDELRLKRTRVVPVNTPTVDILLTLPSSSGTLALSADIPVGSVTLNTAQTITGVKTFTANPVISAITHGIYTSTIPNETGTLAQIEDLDDYVDKTTAQTIAGIKTFSDPVKHSAGASNLPSITFAGDQNSGVYLPAPGVVGLTVSTVDVQGWTSSRAVIMGGSVGTPSLGFGADTTSGLYRSGTDQIGVTITGSNVIDFHADGVHLGNNLYMAGHTIQNTGTLTLPTSTGTLALTSDIPTNATYVDKTTAQTIGGIKTFSAAPVFSAGAGFNTQLITNAKLRTSDVSFADNSDTTKNLSVILSGVSTGVNHFLQFSGTLATTYTFPARAGGGSTTLVDDLNNQTLQGIITFSQTPVFSTITFVNTTTAQTISGVKTFSANPVISQITNIGTLTLPTDTGVVALIADIPTNATYVDKTTAQTVGGVKTFSSAPVISSITNTGTLTLPTTTGTLALISDIPTNATYVDLSTTQTITGAKTATGGWKLGSGGTSLTKGYHANVTTSVGITAASVATIATVDISAADFSGVPHTQVTIQTPASGGTQQWDRVLATVDQGSSTSTSLVILGLNLGAVTTAGTAKISISCLA